MNFLVGGMFISPTGNVSNRAYTYKSSRDVLEELQKIAMKNINDFRYLTNNEYVAYKYTVLTHRIKNRNK